MYKTVSSVDSPHYYGAPKFNGVDIFTILMPYLVFADVNAVSISYPIVCWHRCNAYDIYCTFLAQTQFSHYMLQFASVDV